LAWIETVDESDATGLLKENFDQLHKERGKVPNIHQAHSIKPELLQAYRNFAAAVTFGATSLGREREEMLAITVSALLGCKY
jgi:hypothetical protein